ncbi:hypothetical protein Shyhy02_26800 [Streptomyces hygroscopicus subsp. hygroscopicus]|nr:hypothetical protein Shyhy02_26800 [Streptomyces hygroscopicus subsp. hygroscopicus]
MGAFTDTLTRCGASGKATGRIGRVDFAHLVHIDHRAALMGGTGGRTRTGTPAAPRAAARPPLPACCPRPLLAAARVPPRRPPAARVPSVACRPPLPVAHPLPACRRSRAARRPLPAAR